MMDAKYMADQICDMFESVTEEAVYQQAATQFRLRLRDELVEELRGEQGWTKASEIARLLASICKVELTEGFHTEYPDEFDRLVKVAARGYATVAKVVIHEFGETNLKAMLNDFTVKLVY